MTKCLWTEAEEETLRRLAGEVHVRRIASIMGRSVSSINSRASLCGISLRHKTNKWDKSKFQELSRLRLEGASWEDIAEHFKVGIEACKSALYRHRRALREAMLFEMLEKVQVILQDESISQEQIDNAMKKIKALNFDDFFEGEQG